MELPYVFVLSSGLCTRLRGVYLPAERDLYSSKTRVQVLTFTVLNYFGWRGHMSSLGLNNCTNEKNDVYLSLPSNEYIYMKPVQSCCSWQSLDGQKPRCQQWLVTFFFFFFFPKQDCFIVLIFDLHMYCDDMLINWIRLLSLSRSLLLVVTGCIPSCVPVGVWVWFESSNCWDWPEPKSRRLNDPLVGC